MENVLKIAIQKSGRLNKDSIDLLKEQIKTADDQKVLQTAVRGIEKKQLPHLLCTTNMMLHGIEVPQQIRQANTLKRPLSSIEASEMVDVIVTNPPFGGSEEDGIEKNFPSELQTKETADLFLQYIIEMLKDGGRGAVVLPDGTLFGEGVKTKIKKLLLEECNLHTLIRLPNSVFAPYTSIKTNILFFEKGTPTKDIWYYQLDPGRNMGKTNPLNNKDMEEFVVLQKTKSNTEKSWNLKVADIDAITFDLAPKNPNTPEEAPLRNPKTILQEMQILDKETASILDSIKELIS